MSRKRDNYNTLLLCFDIETTKTIVDGRPVLFTWHWQAMTQEEPGGETSYYTWTSWEDCLSGLLEIAGCRKTICYVHNLSYETEAIVRNLGEHSIDEVFATGTHDMLKFVLDGFVEFRCSYYLTNKSLALCGKDVGLPKLDMDYQQYREPGQEISPEEEEYCKRDVEIMIRKIRQLETQEGLDFWQFPLTNTGFLRNECRKEMAKDKSNRKTFLRLSLLALDYLMCRDSFMGGYVHSNYLYAGEVVPGVDSYDFGSAYPFEMLAHKYPMSKFHLVNRPTWRDIQFMLRSEDMLFICDVELMGDADGGKVVARGSNTYLSLNKCLTSDDVVADNGRLQSASWVRTTVTCLDLRIILKAYTVGRVKVNRLIWAKAGYLPDTLVKCMLKYYERKQKLKGVAGEEENYMKAKNRVNSFYGMMVTSLLHDEIVLDGTEWKVERLDYNNLGLVQEKLNEYYKSYNSFLSYQWGVFVPAWTRFHLWMDIILPNDKNIVYCDTDSAKVINREECLPSINAYNEWAKAIRQKRLRDLGYEEDFPDLGIFDWETEGGAYEGFLTWGAKKYLVKDHGKFKMTVAGLSKKAVKYIESFDDFVPGTIFGKDISGRTVSHYVTNEVETFDHGGCLIEDTTYRLSVSDSYETLLSDSRGLSLEEWREKNSDLLITADGRYHLSRPEVEKEDLNFDIIKEKRNLYRISYKAEEKEEKV